MRNKTEHQLIKIHWLLVNALVSATNNVQLFFFSFSLDLECRRRIYFKISNVFGVHFYAHSWVILLSVSSICFLSVVFYCVFFLDLSFPPLELAVKIKSFTSYTKQHIVFANSNSCMYLFTYKLKMVER